MIAPGGGWLHARRLLRRGTGALPTGAARKNRGLQRHLPHRSQRGSVDPAARFGLWNPQWTAPSGRRRQPACRQLKETPLDALLRDYAPILIFLALAVGLGLVLLLSAAVIAVRNPDPEKVSAYECGFNAFDDARMKFDVRFYLVSILFIIFDLEVAFLFPWAVAFGEISMAAFWSMMAFLAVLTVGFAYEWKKGALEWQ
jgi:NADH-quinone oxidoreductase subunit A